MNKVYKVVYNHTTQVWQVVSDIAKSDSKSKSSAVQQVAPSKRQRILPALRLLLLAGMLAGVQSVQAMPLASSNMNSAGPQLSSMSGPVSGVSVSGFSQPEEPISGINPMPDPNGILVPGGGSNLSYAAPGGNVTGVNTYAFGNRQIAPPVIDINDPLHPRVIFLTHKGGSVTLDGDLRTLRGSLDFVNKCGNGFDLSAGMGGTILDANIKGRHIFIGGSILGQQGTLGFEHNGNGFSITVGRGGKGSISFMIRGHKTIIGFDGKITHEDPMVPLGPPVNNGMLASNDGGGVNIASYAADEPAPSNQTAPRSADGLLASTPDPISSVDEPAPYPEDSIVDVADVDALRDQLLGLQEAGFGLKDQQGSSLSQGLGTAISVVGDENQNISTKVIDQKDGTKALSVQLGNDLILTNEEGHTEWSPQGIAFHNKQDAKADVFAGGLTLEDHDQNRFVGTADRVGMFQGDGSQSIWTSKGLAFEDKDGHAVEVNQNGIGIGNAGYEPVTLTSKGLNNAGNKVINVAAGDVSAQSTDAVNGSQLFDTNKKIDALVDNIQQGPNAVIKGLNFAGDSGSTFNTQLGSTVTITGGVNQPEQLVSGNIGVVSNGQSGLQIGLAKDLKGLNSIQTGAVTMNNAGVVIQAPTQANPNNVVSLTASGLDNGGNRISNVAPGIHGTDAVNVDQLNSFGRQINAMGNQMTQNIQALSNQMSNDMRRLRNDARAGTASAIAAAGLPTASQPNEKLVTLGGGVYHGEAGYAIGISTVSESGHWVLKGTATGDSRNNFGGSGAIGYRWF